MGLLVEGEWKDQWYDTDSHQGKFVRSEAQHRHWITKDGSAGVMGEGGFKAEKDRYHLYVSLACPWAHRTLIYRQLKGLQSLISVSVVDYLMLKNGWEFSKDDSSYQDDLYQKQFLHQIYSLDNKNYTGRVTVPVLWDKKTQRIVNNESADIIRMLNSAFDDVGANQIDFYPEHLRNQIDELNQNIYHKINNGVYKAGFATTQQAYQGSVTQLFKALDELDQILKQNRYLTGEQITEADWRLFTTLIRFDSVYVGHFKCNIRRIEDYPNLSGYLRDLYQQPGIAETVNFEHIKGHYYKSHPMINPTAIVPVGPEINFLAPHNRETKRG